MFAENTTIHDGVAYPLLFSMLPKKGTSNTQERIDLVQRYINLFGRETIDCLLADREFVGEIWINWLNGNGITKKSAGFNIEDAHLSDIKRIEKLLLLVMMAFVWCYNIGEFVNLKPQTHPNPEARTEGQKHIQIRLGHCSGVPNRRT